ncbi:NUDIX domain-containing protein [Colwellia sp. MB02u-18]|uniref:NUDIX domain-containing protein n=1 Tax=unclassified Colwellia TaxID=196834 RepID=UPI0015F4C11A|nr:MULTISPECIES: NUDIX domain-containing protein [unclassified Colwellia]MBA6224278.1 NUDIX domain-containing protein [Colwellia sp. MB3u-45]MBA6265890.1 NUDIX domain-containing protein [Colwellia sp. MB3u-43]MBA6321570.1 NUDIX domain-containing protein [Colwellia sp. MB02u-19]MBA6323662.1 NUDIX domain-containing protein [Colwellia sp. MB02u-18]MBA6331197.1 NUDIX domain-containing protein [Colwellia sp. MB02u-12]
MKKYVTGFLFSQDASHLVLIQKKNPPWQCGLFNGVGGKIETNELSVDAMVREFIEETGVQTHKADWTCYAKIYRPHCYDVDVYFAHSDLAFSAKTIEQEPVHIIKLTELPSNIIPNLQWLIPLALDKQADFSIPVLLQEVAQARTKA